MDKLRYKKFIMLTSLLTIVIFFVMSSLSYAFFNITVTSKEFVIYTGTLAVDYEKKTDVINLEDLYPMTNTQGLNLDSHEFTVENNGTIDARYQVRLELAEEDNMVPIEYIKMSFKENDGEYSEPVLLSDLNSSLVFISNKILNPTKSNTYGIKLWIDLNAPNDIQGKSFKARIVVDSIQNVEDGYVVDTTPIIKLNKTDSGNIDINLKTGEDYTEPGVSQVLDDQDILTTNQVEKTYEYYDGENLTTVDSVDTSKTGIYYITYSITDKSGNTGKATRVVTVNNNEVPTITLNGNSSITLGEYDDYIEKGVTVENNNQVTTIGEVKTSTVGTYIVRYIVVDSNNNLNSVTRTVIVNSAYTEEILNGADPVLTQNLVPVIIDDNGTVTRSSTLSTWYDYETKNWANAVVTKNSYDTLNSYGKVTGATKNDGYVSLDGVDDYVNLGLASYEFTDGMTVSMRFAFNSLTTSQEFIGNWEVSGFGCGLYDSKILCNLYNTETSKWSWVRSSEIVEIGRYYTIAYTYDNNEMKLYIDGVLIDSNELGLSIKTSAAPIFLGANPSKSGTSGVNFSNIDVEAVAIFDRAVTEEEIKTGFTDDIKVYNDDSLLVYEDFTEKVYDNDEVIPEDSIESYFVWIPKYSYQLWDLGDYSSLTSISSKEQTINVKFGLANTSDTMVGECTTPGVAGESGSCAVGDYMTHPAFLAFDTNGFWVGKFETGYDGATTTDTAQVNSSDSSKIIIKPNVYSWRSSTVGNMFKASLDYLTSDNSHMMKNTEWGAVAYLQHSAYGSQTSVRINNNSAYITGYAATVEPTLGYNGGTSTEGNRVESTSLGVDGTYTTNYLNASSVVASTTGNYTGIYDVSGGAWEYVMGYTTGATTVGGSSGITSLYSDFYTNSAWEKYYDKYASTVYTNYNNRILGDATGEMGPFGTEVEPDEATIAKSSWYRDYAQSVISSYPWFERGGSWNRGSGSGAFAFYFATGGSGAFLSYRVVLAPTHY